MLFDLFSFHFILPSPLDRHMIKEQSDKASIGILEQGSLI